MGVDMGVDVDVDSDVKWTFALLIFHVSFLIVSQCSRMDGL